MASPQGKMFVPLIVNPSGDIRTLECDASDRLKVTVDAITAALVATQSNPDSLRVGNYLWDGSAWQKVSGNTSGEQQTRVGYDGANWQRLATDSNGVQKTLSGLDGTTYRGLKVDANGRLSVDINSAPTITNQNKVYDGSNWQNALAFSDGVQRVANEPNRIFDVSGVTQILVDGSATNTESTIYTTPTGKQGFISSVMIYGNNTGAAISAAQMRVYDSTPTLKCTWYLAVLANSSDSKPIPFGIPIYLAAGWSIRIFSPAATFVSRLAITGYDK